VEAYLVRVAKYAKCSPACFVQAVALVFRLAKRDAAYQLTSLNVHRLVLTGVLLSAKFLDDHYYNNAYYARVGGVSTAELNRLEVEMLRLLGFRLLVPREELEQLLLDAQVGRARAGGRVARAGGVAAAVGWLWFLLLEDGLADRRSLPAAHPPLPQAGCLAGQVVARWRCGRKRRSHGLDDGGPACDAGSRRASLELAAQQRRFGRVMA
jgi:hypothetical protein